MPAPKNLTDLRRDARGILDACLEAADARKAVRRFVYVRGDDLVLATDLHMTLSDFDRILVVGAGKASAAMGRAVEDLLGKRVTGGLICVKYGHGLPLERIQVLEAGHPLPDRAGEEAARAIMSLLESATEKDLVIACMSGGGSALLPATAKPVNLDQKEKVTKALLAVGANIHEINTVRKHLSLTKGGNLMRMAYPAFVINLMLSDVIGNEPDTIASGPFVPDRSSFGEALEILRRYGLLETVEREIVQRVRDGAEGKVPETPKPGDPIFRRVVSLIVGSNILSLQAGAVKARELGYSALVLSSSVGGDTTQAAFFHAAIAQEIHGSGNPLQAPACVLSGGETTVKIRGKGRGGRNQEFALALIQRVTQLPNTLFLSAGTDGTDGPTDAAGALVDTQSMERAADLGLEPGPYLENNDSYTFFSKLGDLIFTGPTRTNVMDVRLILVGDRTTRG